jgi:transketolase
MNHLNLNAVSLKVRISAMLAIHAAGSGHPGGALSCADLLAYVWLEELDVSNREDMDRNRFILSKGHACPALYAVAAEFGLIQHQQLLSLRKLGSPLQGHAHVVDLPWVETSTGSLGQGFSVSIGMAMGLRHKKSRARVYVMLGDGELQEGEVWEGAMCAAHYGLDNLCGIIDYNKMQSDDLNENIMALEPLNAKWRAFGWHVVEIDGHDFEQMHAAFSEARRTKDKPTMIIAHTIKGKGVSFMEGSPLWHGSVKLREEELEQALRDLGLSTDEIRGYVDGTIWK